MAPRTLPAPVHAGQPNNVSAGSSMRIALVSIACIILGALLVRQTSFLESMLTPENRRSVSTSIQQLPELPIARNELSTGTMETDSTHTGSTGEGDESEEENEEVVEEEEEEEGENIELEATSPSPSASPQPSMSAAPTVTPSAKPQVAKQQQQEKGKQKQVPKGLTKASRSATATPAPPFPVLPHNEALPRSCETCVEGASIYRHYHNPTAKHKITFANFTCPVILPHQYFFSIVDCLAPLSGLMGHILQSGQHVHVYLHDFIARFWPPFHDVFQRAGVSYEIIRQDSVYPYVANATDYIDRFEFVRTIPVKEYTRNVCKVCFRDLMYEHELLPAQDTCNSVVFVSRNGTRAILDQGALMAQLQVVSAPYNIGVVPFYGNESVSTMVHMFADACAVVGYHGAGETNAIFSRNNTLVVEVDTYRHPDEYTRVWRTNKPSITENMGLTLHWNTYMITYEHLRPVVNASIYYTHPKFMKEQDWDQYIKAKSAYLGPEHIANVSAIVAEHLDTLFPSLP